MTRPGYKMTEIGEIPEDWDLKRIRECAEVKYGRSNPKTEGMIPLIGSSGVFGAVSEPLIYAPTIVIGRKGTAGAVWDVRTPSWPSDTAFYLEYKTEISQKFLFEFMSLNKLTGEHAKTTLPSVKREEIEEFLFPFPPLPEQKKIAEILSSMDEAIQRVNDKVTKTERLKKGLMQTLLTKGIGHTNFKMTEIGEIPQEWDLRNIEQICQKPQYGFTESASFVHDGPKFLRITDIQDGAVNWNSVPFCNCSKEILEKYKLTSGDILFARTGATTGKSFIVKNPPVSIFASYLIRIRSKVVVNPVYLYMYLNSGAYWRQIKQRISGSAQGGVNASLLCKILVAVPPHPEQQKIAEILSDADKEIEALEQKRDKYKLFKMGMMQQLLTGRIRVND